MKSLIKWGTLTYGGYLGTKSIYNNYIRTVPPDPKLHEKKNKKIVVVGAGIVGLTTAYYLSKYEDNEVVLVEKATKCAMECSIQNGCLLMRRNANPWTYRPIKSVINGIWRSDTSQAIYPTKAM